jgi:hypothetical protein
VQAGEKVAQRFLLEAEAGVGGMGRVYRARDLQAGGPVAVKILSGSVGADGAERFQREIDLVGALSHPNLVRYVAHGATADGHPFLAMEWVEGETLSARLARGPLPLEEALAVGLGVAAALAAAHRAGVVHRDVKPANVLLARDGQVKLVDLGIARRLEDAAGPTRTGIIVGSCLYMSPEQALGGRNIGTHSDVFSLGAVLYECASGQRAFGARDATAALAKILLDDPTPLRDVASVPAELDALVARMLAKRPDQRPADGAEVLEALSAVSAIPSPPASRRADSRRLGDRERRVVWVVLARPFGGADDDTIVVDAAPTLTKERPVREDEPSMERTAARFGARLSLLADGSAIATFDEDTGATLDLGRRAGRCALALRDVVRGPVALGMGLAVVSERVPMGALLDAASTGLDGAQHGEIRLVGAAPEALASAFELHEDTRGAWLLGERAAGRGAGRGAGRSSPYVGRERELEMLVSAFEACTAERTSRAVVVTGPAGAGKTRLCDELLARLEALDAFVLAGRAEELAAGASFTALADALRRAAGVEDDAPPEEQQEALLRFAQCFFPRAGDARWIAEMLGEICGVPFPDADREPLRMVRRDTRELGDAVRAGFEEWLRAAVAAQPVVLVLDDLHWGDLPSVRLVDAALAATVDGPLFVVALGRPELDARFPGLFGERAPSRLALHPLGRRAAGRLVREVLGEGAPDALVEQIVERSEGNAFFLEELLRNAAADAGPEGSEPSLPATVLAMVQARLGGLRAEERRVLRAASVHGMRFARASVRAVLGDAEPETALDEALARLVADEWLVDLGTTERAYAFRQTLVRETAYRLSTDEDRRQAHLLAAEHLERTGAADPAVIAEHLERAGAAERAAEVRARASRWRGA